MRSVATLPKRKMILMRHSLFKYFSERKWADAFLDGQLLFRSLAYFRDYEDENVRGDHNEGRALFYPEGGLIMNNETQGKIFNFPGYGLESEAKQEEIFVFCASRSLTDEQRAAFGAIVCVEVLQIRTFCERIEAALPANCKFPGKPGRTRIGQRVEYYPKTESGSPRWALPDKISTSKLDGYAWQDEFRLVFSLTDALGFENVKMQMVPQNARKPADVAQHHCYLVKAQSLRGICRIHEF